MDKHFENIILRSTGASSLYRMEQIQELWSGYGSIIRYGLEGAERNTVVVKHVRMLANDRHPRGWNSDLGHKRKLKSYKVETAWYGTFASRCGDECRIPECLALEKRGDEVLMVLEDLDGAGFPSRKRRVSMAEIGECLAWLANFHAEFMGDSPEGLWKNGTYWHLDTRPEELKALDDQALRKAAGRIDLLLKKSSFLTFVHGDAKLANFCFSRDGSRVAAVDFQYVGGGCGMKDVAYFLSSCLYEEDCERYEGRLLDLYFNRLRGALEARGKKVDADALERDWRELYPVAWTDFHRFIKGWSPGHWKINSYSERLAREVAGKILNQTDGTA